MGLLLPFSVYAAERQLPNIVVVMADDLGIGDLGCYGQTKIETPHIDSLASHGLLFAQHYSGSTVSAPSRCCFLTGKHTGTAYVRGNRGVRTSEGVSDLPLPEQEVTVAELLKSCGYSTMCVGKWGLGSAGTSGFPLCQGFDYFFGYLSQGEAHRYYPQYLYENGKKVMLEGKVYSHWMIMEKGLDFIRKQKEGQPYFAFFAITPPHADLDYPDIGKYQGKFPEKPYVNKSGKGGFKTQMNPKATYASMVTEIDNSVGRIVSLIKERGEWENTVFIFTSDNGVHHVGGHDPDFFDSNGPFRGYKRDLYEGGVRTPFVVSWPDVISAPRKTGHIAAFWDFLPTVCEIAGADVPSGSNGISYLPVLRDEPEKQKQHESVYFEFYEGGGKQAIMKDGWKLVRLNLSRPEKLKEELYYLPEDISESRNLISENPEKVNELRRLMKEAHTESDLFNWKK